MIDVSDKQGTKQEILWVMEHEDDPTMITYQVVRKVLGKSYECNDYPYRKVLQYLNEMTDNGELYKTNTGRGQCVWMAKARDTKRSYPDWQNHLMSEIPF